MRFMRGTVLALLLVAFGGVLAGCESMEDFQFWDTKKKLAGDRKEVFPGGVPGVTQGIPPDLVKGYQEPQQPETDPAAVAAQESAEKIQPKPDAKPKPKKVAKPRPVQQPQQPASAGQGGFPGQQPQQAQQPQPTQAPWPGSQPQAQQQSGWPQAH
ncbi:MAG TPA: hypothetical protein VLX44_01170 [Xanthobacteraceae bacterium]|nr:hypothetical protein [Xanthobacteraceae bacterium]